MPPTGSADPGLSGSGALVGELFEEGFWGV